MKYAFFHFFFLKVLLPHALHCPWQLADSCVEMIQLTNVLKKEESNIPAGGIHLDLSCHTWADAGWPVTHVALYTLQILHSAMSIWAPTAPSHHSAAGP